MTGRLVTGAITIGLALRLTPADDGLVITVPQRDNVRSAFGPATVDVSADARYVAFESYAQLVPGDTDQGRDVYVLDRVTRNVTLESTGLAGDSSHPRISGDGRFVVFESFTTIDDAAPLHTNIIVRDRSTNRATVLAGLHGEVPDGQSRCGEISDDGRIVVFASAATNLVPGLDANGGAEDVYSFDVQTGVIRRVSVDNAGVQPASGSSMLPSISADGRWIAFVSSAPLDVAHAAAGHVDDHQTLGRGPSTSGRLPRHVYLRDRVLGTTTRLGIGGRNRPDPDSGSPVISGDGRYIAFVSEASNLVTPDRNGVADVFLFDRQTGSITLVSRAVDGGSANGISLNPALSHDGRFVGFQSDASNLVCARRCPAALEDINLLWDVFVFDRQKDVIVRASGDELGGWMEPSAGPALSAKGDVVAFSSRHPINPLDRGEDFDLFVRLMPAIAVPTTRW